MGNCEIKKTPLSIIKKVFKTKLIAYEKTILTNLLNLP